MSELMDFIRDNYLSIIIVISFVIILLAAINIRGIDLNAPKPESKLVQQITFYS